MPRVSRKKIGGGLPSFVTLENVLIVIIVILLIIAGYQLYARNTTESFTDDKLIPSGHKSNFVMFYADWCPHCQTAKPHFKRMKEVAKTKYPKCKLTLLDADKNQELSQKYEIEGYPTFKLIGKNGNVKDFDSTPDFDGFNEFLKNNV
jgi:thiol-disulfide isomerase/thioredoxin